MALCSKFLLALFISASVTPSFGADFIPFEKYSDALDLVTIIPHNNRLGNCEFSYSEHPGFRRAVDFYVQTPNLAKTFLFTLGIKDSHRSLQYRPTTPAFTDNVGVLFDHSPESSYSNKSQFYVKNDMTRELIGLKVNKVDFKVSRGRFYQEIITPVYSTFSCGNVGRQP